MNAAVVFDVAELSEAIHEEAHARPSGTDHLSKSLLGDEGDEGYGLASLPKFRHQQQGSRQTPFAGVEELINEIRLCPNTPSHDELHKVVGETMFIVQDPEHLSTRNPEYNAYCDSRGRCCAKLFRASHRLFAEEVARGKQRNCGFLAFPGNDGEPGPAVLEIEHTVGGASLAKEGLAYLVAYDGSPRPIGGEKLRRIKWHSA